MADLLLGVNIDHIATLRNARGTNYPDPVQAAFIAEQAGADGITVHLREDRRHITDRDVRILRQTIQTRMNLEMAVTDEMLDIAIELKPQFCCLVPEKRQEVTTEGGLDVAGQQDKMAVAVERLAQAGILVSLFIDADHRQIDAAVAVGAPYIEIHTGAYAEAQGDLAIQAELKRIAKAATYAASKGLKVNAGHGLTYHNVQPIAALPEMYELNIGHAIIGPGGDERFTGRGGGHETVDAGSASLMAILGLGTDIVEMARIEAVVERSGDRLARRVLSPAEWEVYQQHQQPVRFLAKRFAVKEAAAKAFGTGIRNGLAFNQFEVFNDGLGKPNIRLHERAAELAQEMGVKSIHVSLADERRYACATVIIEG